MRRRSCLTTLVLAVLLACRATADQSTTSEPPRVGIDNFVCLNLTYCRGAQPEGNDYRDLAAFGIRTVVDLRKDFVESEQPAVELAGMRFYRIPLTTTDRPAPEAVARFLEIVNDPANQPVFVHCAGGRHRTGAMTAVYRMTRDQWTADEASAEMKRYEFGPDFLHPELKRFVYAFYEQLKSGARPPVGR